MRILGIGGSPRRHGNSDTLLDWALESLSHDGHDVKKLCLNKLAIAPCQECGGCNNSGQCRIQDDMQKVYPELRTADGFILSSPVFFSSLSAQLKAMIDRTQACWVEKYLLKRKVTESEGPRKAIFLAAGARHEDKNFACMERTIRVFCITQEAQYVGGIFFPGMESKGDIKKVTDARDKVVTMTRSLY